MPIGIPVAGVRAKARPKVTLSGAQRAAIRLQWRANLRQIGVDPDDALSKGQRIAVGQWLREAGLPTQLELARQHGVSEYVISYLVRDLPYPPRPGRRVA